MTTSQLGSVSSAIAASLYQKPSGSPKNTALFGGLVDQIESSSGETTQSTTDGGSVTTIKGSDGKNQIVSETSAKGETLTQVGYVSPVLLQNFLDSLGQALTTDGSQASASTSTSATSAAGTNGVDIGSRIPAAVQNLLSQLSTNTPQQSISVGLLNSFDTLMQNSGEPVGPSSGGASKQTSQSALLSFLKNALSGAPTQGPSIGSSVNQSA